MSVPLLISPSSHYLSQPNTVILDASWLYEPPAHRNAHREYLENPRIPNARWWDLDEVSEPHPDGYPLMLPSPERFASFAGDHGISRDSHVIVYDGEGVFASPRTAWTFKVYGHEKVSIINGGLPKAKADGVKLEDGPPKAYQKTTYPIPTIIPGAVAQYDDILTLASRSSPSQNGTLLIDARPVSSYESGHIPSSLSFDFPTSLHTDSEGHTSIRQPEELKQLLEEQYGKDVVADILSGKTSVVNTCGGGLSAAINWTQFQSLNVDSKLYDESWSGYSARSDNKRITGSEPF